MYINYEDKLVDFGGSYRNTREQVRVVCLNDIFSCIYGQNDFHHF